MTPHIFDIFFKKHFVILHFLHFFILHFLQFHLFCIFLFFTFYIHMFYIFSLCIFYIFTLHFSPFWLKAISVRTELHSSVRLCVSEGLFVDLPFVD